MVLLYFLTLLALGVYSYSQIDLNLTLLQTPWFLDFQVAMIRLGYFNRSLSTEIFVVLLGLLTILYSFLLRRAERFSWGNLKALLAVMVLVGLFSYPAFSHDIFNYIFDARILVAHHANPYTSTALMFPTDTWTRFMNWTHRTYPYGPFFLPLTVPFYLLGLGKFISTLISFKLMSALAYLGSGYFLYKLGGKTALLAFALNPLIIAEGLIAGHLDMVMLVLALAGVYFLSIKRGIWGWIFWGLSVGVKYATGVFVPVFLLWNKLKEQQRYLWLAILAGLSGLAQMVGRELLPHYFIVFIGLAALLSERKFWRAVIIFLPLILLLVRYGPYFYYGQWWTIKIF